MGTAWLLSYARNAKARKELEIKKYLGKKYGKQSRKIESREFVAIPRTCWRFLYFQTRVYFSFQKSMTTHVFIVESTTFKLHLEYLFAGTGAKDNRIDFNNNPNTSLHATTENMLIGMIADGSRIRRGDQIIFYLQQEFSKKIFEGKFFGIFKAKNDWSFLDNNDRQQYLKDELEKSLTFRTLIEPYKVYSEGVTEWEALDEIRNIKLPNQMLWSLIYRKLKGNRGNTMITIYESERLSKLILDKNSGNMLPNNGFTFNTTNQEIQSIAEAKRYTGKNESINILPRL